MMRSMPPTWRTVRLGDLTLPVERTDPASQFTRTFNYIDISAVDNVSKKVIGNLEQNVREAPSRARQLVYSGDVLVSTVRPALNAVAAVPDGLSNGVASTGFCVLRPRPAALLPEYLLRFVITGTFIQSLVSRQKGGAYPAVTDDEVRSVPIPLPPLSEQQRIVEILHEAEEIRRLRAEAEAKTSELIPAMFYEHFVSGKAHDFQPLRKLADVVSGVAIGRRTKGMTVEVPYLRVANVQAGFVDLSEIKTTNATDEEIVQFALQDGDVLLTEGGDFDKLGRGCLWNGQIDPCIHQNHVFRVRPALGKLNSRFFAHYLQSAKAKHYFLRCAKKTTNLASINLTQLKALPVPNISIEDQERFELQIQVASESTPPTADRIFGALALSLSAHAFSGRLTSDWREAHQDKLALEARERDAMLKEVGANLSRSRHATIQEMESIWEQPTDGIYSDLNREQRALLFRIQQSVGGVQYARYFSAQSLSESLNGSLRRNPHAIEGHLAVFAARGLVVPVSREEQSEDTGDFVFGNAYRLPLNDLEPTEGEESGSQVGDHTQGSELERLVAQLERERALT
jgi:type I restriction enzyme, S subunit